jgi:uncharacterized membrane protein
VRVENDTPSAGEANEVEEPAPVPARTPLTALPGLETLGKGRIEAFSDGVFAIAITLLVLEIKIPEGLSHRDLLHALSAELPHRLFAYALSFAIVGVYWVAHHLMFAAFRFVDRTVLWMNNLFLLFAASIPFSAALLGNYPNDPAASAIYGCHLIGTSGALFLLWRYATAGCRLLSGTISPFVVRAGSVRTLVSMAIYGLAAVASFWSTTVAYALYWIVPVGYIFVQGYADRRGPLKRTPPPGEIPAAGE